MGGEVVSGKDGASRSARWRRRTELCESGDHQLCTPRTKCPVVGAARPPVDPVQAPAVTPAGDVTSDVTPPPESPVTKVPPPAGLTPRGSRLWEAESGNARDVGHLLLLEEACRCVDTLERLHEMRQADDSTLLELVRNDAESTDEVVEVRVVVNGLLVEQRQQMDVFRRQVAELRLAGRSSAAGQASPGVAGAGTPELSAGEASAAPGSPANGEGGIGDLIDAARRFTSQG